MKKILLILVIALVALLIAVFWANYPQTALNSKFLSIKCNDSLYIQIIGGSQSIDKVNVNFSSKEDTMFLSVDLIPVTPFSFNEFSASKRINLPSTIKVIKLYEKEYEVKNGCAQLVN